MTSSGATATLAQWQAALRAVTFSSTSSTYGARTLTFTVSDGAHTSVAATDVVSVGDPSPALTLTSGAAAFTEADNAATTPIAVDDHLTLTDPDDAPQARRPRSASACSPARTCSASSTTGRRWAT